MRDQYCSRCRALLSAENAYRRRHVGWQPYCKTCQNEYCAQYRQRVKERRLRMLEEILNKRVENEGLS
jgi:hypothetical protein